MMDVYEGTQLWAIGLSSHESLATEGNITNTDYRFQILVQQKCG